MKKIKQTEYSRFFMGLNLAITTLSLLATLVLGYVYLQDRTVLQRQAHSAGKTE